MKTPLIKERQQTSRLLPLFLLLVLLVGLIGVWKAELLPVESDEVPIGVVTVVAMEAAAILDVTTGPLTLYKDKLGTADWPKLWMYSIPSDYCWSSTAYNALRLVAKPAFDAGLADPESTAKGFIRTAKDKSEKNITPQLRYFIARMTDVGQDPTSRGECDASLWVRNFVGDVNLMGIDKEGDKECFGYGVPKTALPKLGIGVDGSVSQASYVRTMKQKLDENYSVVVGVAFGAREGYKHYLTIGGYFMKGSEEWFLILNPVSSPAARDPADSYPGWSDASLYPWGAFQLRPVQKTGKIKVMGADNVTKFWICFVTWVRPKADELIRANFDLLKPR